MRQSTNSVKEARTTEKEKSHEQSISVEGNYQWKVDGDVCKSNEDNEDMELTKNWAERQEEMEEAK